MSIRVACLWCGIKNDLTKARMNNLPIYCQSCGHRADKAPVRCDCKQCTGELAEASHPPEQANLFEDTRDDA
jgi:hypothetical protein